jgi:predicted dehydrogenase
MTFSNQTNRRLSVAIIGVGAISETVHIPTIAMLEGLRIDRLVDPFADSHKLDRISQTLGCSWSRTIDDVAVDLAVVAVPISQHFHIAKTIISKGIHALIEKPLVPSLQEAEELLSIARATKSRIFCGQVRRFYENVETAREAIECGMIGSLERVSIFEGNLYGWNRSFFSKERNRDASIDEGVLFDVGSHGIDCAMYALQDLKPAVTISSSITDDLNLQTNVEVKGEIDFIGGKATLSAAFSNSIALANCIWFKGSAGTLLLSPNPSVMPRFFARNRSRMLVLDRVKKRNESAFLIQYQTVLEALRLEKETKIDAQSILPTVATLEVIFTGMTEGKCSWLTT